MRFIGKQLNKVEEEVYEFNTENIKDPDYPRAFFAPEECKTQKDFLSCVMDMLTQDFNYPLFDLTPKEYGKFKNGSNCDIRLAMLLKDLASTMTWIVNSTSMRDGELKDFDIFEIKNKLENLRLNERG